MFIVALTCNHLIGQVSKLLSKVKKEEYIMLSSSLEELEEKSAIEQKTKNSRATKIIVIMHEGCQDDAITPGAQLRYLVETEENNDDIPVEIVLAKTTKRGINFHRVRFINGNILPSEPIVQIVKNGGIIFQS